MSELIKKKDRTSAENTEKDNIGKANTGKENTGKNNKNSRKMKKVGKNRRIKTPLLIVVLVISTLLLIADLVFYTATKNLASVTFPGSTTEMQMPGNFSGSDYNNGSAGDGEEDSTENAGDQAGSGQTNQGQMPSMPTDGEMSTEMGEMSSMPQGGQMPSMSSDGEMSTEMGEMPSMPQGGQMPSMSSDGEMSTEMGEMSSMPQGGNMQGMPGSSDSTTGNDGSSTGTDSTGTDGSTDSASESADSSSSMTMPSGMSDFSAMQTKISRITTLRKFCIPFAVLFALIDAACIILLICGRKKGPKGGSGAAGENAEELEALTEEEREARAARLAVEESIAKRSKAKKRNGIIAIVLVAVLVLIGVLSGLVRNSAVTSGTDVEEKLISGTVEDGDISSTLNGTGTLTSEDADTVSIPGNVTIVSYAVSNGDTVEEGDLIATVDKTTVLSSIAELQTLMDELDAELDEVADETIDDTIEATADGRVMAIYAENGTSVVDTMYENQALMIISLDGYLAIDFTSEETYTIGTSVSVVTDDGDTYTGRIAAIDQNTITVTVTDDGPALGENVTVKDSAGNTLTSGPLYVHSAQKITGFAGTVKKVKVSVGDEVEAGDTLMTLKDTDYDANYDTLVDQRATLEEQMSELMKAYMTGGIYAEKKGIISGISDDAVVSEADSSTGSDQNEDTLVALIHEERAALMTEAEDTVTVEAETLQTGGAESGENSGSTAGEGSTGKESTDGNSGSESGSTGSGTAGGSSDSGSTGSGSSSDSGNAGSGSESGSRGSSSDSGSTGSEGGSAGSGSSSDSGNTGSGTAGESGSTGTETTDDTLSVSELAQWILSLDNATLNKFLNTLDYNTLKTIFDAMRTFESESTESGESGADTDPTGGNTQPGGSSTDTDPTGGNSGTAADGTDISSSDLADLIQGATGGTGTSSASISSLFSSSAASALTSSLSSDSSADSDEDSTKSYTFAETDLCTVTPNDTMTIDITVDELDILSAALSANVQVTIDALAGQSFEGTITKIDTDGTNSGGDTKYTVTVTIDRTEDMIEGMNGSATVVLDTSENVLYVPTAALQEESGKVYVYTGYDEKKDQLTDPVEVTTGVSDGTNTEITAGLEEGDSYYYKYAGTIIYNFVNQTEDTTE